MHRPIEMTFSSRNQSRILVFDQLVVIVVTFLSYDPGNGTPFDLKTNRSELETNEDEIAFSETPSPNLFRLYLVDGGAFGFFSEKIQ